MGTYTQIREVDFVHFDITSIGIVSYATTLEPNGLVTALTANDYALPGGDSCPLIIAVMVNR